MKTFDHTLSKTLKNRALWLFGRIALVAVIALGMTLPVALTEREAAAQNPVVKPGKRVKKKVVKKQGDKQLVKRTVRPVRTHTRHTTVYHHHTPRHTTVHHYNNGGSQGAGPRTVARASEPRSTPYLTLGVGAVGTDSSVSAEEASTGLSVGLGLRASRHLALELGLLGVVSASDLPGDESNQELEFGGVSTDAKLILPFGPVEPYGLVGAGLYTLDNNNTSSMEPAVNLGLGADFKIADNIGIGGRYVYHGFWFDEVGGSVRDEQIGSAWSGMGMLSVSF